MSKHYFIWVEERHNIGISAIDSEHREIAAHVNLIVAATSQGAPIGEVKEMLNEMVAFVGEHFAHEERLMLEHGYPEMEMHAEEHAKLILQLNNLIQKAPCAALTPAFLVDWMEQHMLLEDTKLGKHLVSKGIA